FDIEYWSLEEAKLRRLPAEKELARRIIAVVGAGSGIGKAAAHRLANEGAHVVCADVDEVAAKRTAEEITSMRGAGSGIGGTGISNCGPAIGLSCELTNRANVAQMLEEVGFASGGLDSLVITAGVVFAPDKTGRIEDQQWDRTFAINVRGGY